MIIERIKKIRELMVKNNLSAYIIPSSDAHMSEYVPEYYKAREWVSGFTGSAGTVVITQTDVGLWTDGRYWIQANIQLEGSGIDLYKTGLPNSITITNWLKEKLDSTSNVGIDARVFSTTYVKGLEKSLGCNIVDVDLVDELWEDRPEIPTQPAFLHTLRHTGLTTVEKLKQVRDMMKDNKVSNFILATLDDICWLYNIRAFDVINNPVLISYALVTPKKAYLFTDLNKVKHLNLEQEGITALPYEEVVNYISELDTPVYFDSNKTNYYISSKLKDITIKNGINFTTTLKAKKNSSEILNLKNCQIKDGVAMTKFLYWFDKNKDKGLNELSVEEQLYWFRRHQENFIEKSFDPISAYGPNAAMMHYRATRDSYADIEEKGFYLIDSGGQYIDGTTDITRTAVCGELTEEQVLDYTLVLKGHIQLSMATFLEGTAGANLDVLARKPMWEYGLDYKCGTGHGVGYLLNVHEGPHGFNKANKVPLEPGMVITNEPGIYKEGKHGIRIENTLLVTEYMSTEFGNFYQFETISYCPIDLRAVNVDLLTQEEIDWLTTYHNDVYDKLSPFLEEEKQWFKEITTLKGI